MFFFFQISILFCPVLRQYLLNPRVVGLRHPPGVVCCKNGRFWRLLESRYFRLTSIELLDAPSFLPHNSHHHSSVVCLHATCIVTARFTCAHHPVHTERLTIKFSGHGGNFNFRQVADKRMADGTPLQWFVRRRLISMIPHISAQTAINSHICKFTSIPGEMRSNSPFARQCGQWLLRGSDRCRSG